MESIDKRIILWNKTLLEASAAETWKMLFRGHTIPTNVKYIMPLL